MGNGTRTHNARNHNPVLCQLNYTHHMKLKIIMHYALYIMHSKWHARRGSEGSAACGRCSDLSEWQRSAYDAAALSARKMPGTATGHDQPRIEVIKTLGINGTPEGTRTPDLLLRRQLLYPAELLAHILERVTGIGPAYPAWKAGVLPLNYTRKSRNLVYSARKF